MDFESANALLAIHAFANLLPRVVSSINHCWTSGRCHEPLDANLRLTAPPSNQQAQKLRVSMFACLFIQSTTFAYVTRGMIIACIYARSSPHMSSFSFHWDRLLLVVCVFDGLKVLGLQVRLGSLKLKVRRQRRTLAVTVLR